MFYAGRAVCSQATTADHQLGPRRNVGLGCGTLHVWDPRTAGRAPRTRTRRRSRKIGELQVFGAKGSGGETGTNSKDEQGILGIALDPDFTNGRPYIYVQYHPYFSGEQGNGSMQRGTKSSARASSAPTTWASGASRASPTTTRPRRSFPARRRSSCTG